ncbi:glucosaminidase domain-containing protein [Flavobacterium sp. MFBS3-15]|uniref:glucosaminidase domain-containing protein n=1 Tax=Flavobacterium sp. MFBS3-15 TaxID=2989816 RepID=UPI0022367E1D|nr:glucosaminidase domain-containing protein [Flavobacterium sp. MFBS3-15]MCW4467370.1 glucosaminidase domain-containing protein [Flavobacterium sp. MFBS3-15]
MFRKILALAVLGLLVSCGTSKSRIQTTKSGVAKTKTSSKKKPKPANTKTSTASNSNSGRTTETLESTSKTVVYSDMVKAYVLEYKEIAKDNMRRHGIPASITLAQGILESGAGRGTLCVNANNHFGIKCHTGWDGEKVYHDDDAEQECFRKYAKGAESYNDHSLFLTTRGRYASLFQLRKDDYEAWARGLRAAGYATDPKYPEKLIGLIERYDLAAYDAEVLNKTYVKPAPKAAPAATEEVLAAGSYRVVQGDTLYSISKKHNLSVDELMRLNGLSNNAISIGQVLKVK